MKGNPRVLDTIHKEGFDLVRINTRPNTWRVECKVPGCPGPLQYLKGHGKSPRTYSSEELANRIACAHVLRMHKNPMAMVKVDQTQVEVHDKPEKAARSLRPVSFNVINAFVASAINGDVDLGMTEHSRGVASCLVQLVVFTSHATKVGGS